MGTAMTQSEPKADANLTAMMRPFVVAMEFSFAGLVLTGLLALAAVFTRESAFGTAAFVALIISLLANAFIAAWKAWLVVRHQASTGTGEAPAAGSGRVQAPVASHLLVATIHIGVAAYLAYVCIERL